METETARCFPPSRRDRDSWTRSCSPAPLSCLSFRQMPEVQTVLLTRHRDNWASGHHLPLTLSPEEAQRPRGSATPWGCPSSLSHPGADFKVFGQKQDVKYLSNL